MSTVFHFSSNAVAAGCRASRLLQPVDLYTGLAVTASRYSREHLIPKSVIIAAGCPQQAVWDLANLFCVDRQLNSRRSNFKFVLPWRESSGPEECLFDCKHRIFAPPTRARGIVARTTLLMIDRYPSLQSALPLIIEPAALDAWVHLPVTEYEQNHTAFVARHSAARSRVKSNTRRAQGHHLQGEHSSCTPNRPEHSRSWQQAEGCRRPCTPMLHLYPGLSAPLLGEEEVA